MRDRNMHRFTDYLSKKPGDAVKDMKTPCLCFGSGVEICIPYIADIVDSKDILILRDGVRKVTGEVLIREGLKKGQPLEGTIIEAIYGRRSEAEIKFNIEAL